MTRGSASGDSTGVSPSGKLTRGWARVSAAWRALTQRRQLDAEMDEEMRFHVEMETAKNVREGMSPEDARRKALVDFGGMTQAREAHRAVRGMPWLEDAAADARYALRGMRRSPALAGAAILTLALGIGANTAIFSAVNAVILRPLPYPHADRLVMISEDNPEKGWVRQYAAPANFMDWRARVHAFQDMAAYMDGGGATIVVNDVAQRIRSRGVTGTYFDVLGARAELGRTFDSAETWDTGTPLAILSHQLWVDAFGSNRSVIGTHVMIDGTSTEIVGVMPASFSFAADTIDVWQNTAFTHGFAATVAFRRAHFIRVIGRMKPGVTADAANAELQTVVTQLQHEFPETNRVMGADLVPLHEYLIGDVKPALLVLQAAVALLLLIACVNVGNLMLVHALGREREASLRLTLGAGHGRLVRQAFTESLVLSALGGIAGLGLGWYGTRALAALQPTGMLPVANVTMDVRVLLAIFAVTTLAGLFFGIAPALWTTRRAPAEVLKEGGRGGVGHRVRRWGDVLVAAEIALALTLTLGAGLLVRSFWRLQQVHPGIETRGALAVGIRLGSSYDSAAKRIAFFDDLRSRARALPGVTGVALATVAPLSGYAFSSDYHIMGRGPEDYGTEIGHDRVTPEYFRMLQVPLVAGRAFTDADRDGSTPVVIINQALAEKEFHGRSAVGEQITFDKHPDSSSVWRTIVGVVGNIHESGLAAEPKIMAYTAFAQTPNSYMTLVARTDGDLGALATALRRVVADMDRGIALAQVQPLAVLEQRSIARQRFIMSLILVFATTGFALAVVGIYGVMAQMARRRTREMGIRLALGARAGEVQWLVLRHSLGLVAAGTLGGLLAAFAGTRAIRTLLYNTAPTDPLTFIAVPLLLAGTAALASWLPALRASRTQPAVTLREE